jgi:probable phosphoglycerate mutase
MESLPRDVIDPTAAPAIKPALIPTQNPVLFFISVTPFIGTELVYDRFIKKIGEEFAKNQPRVYNDLMIRSSTFSGGTMTTIYLIRHAEAEGNLYRIAQGQKNSNLTDRGWRQVRALQRRFADVHIDAVYSSDLYRTCATATAIYKPKGLPLHREPGLREINVGRWEQRTWGDIVRESPEQMKYFSTQPTRWHVEGAETPQQVQRRALATIRRIAAENDGKTVAVFSHGYAIRLILAALQGCPLERLGETPTGDNTAVSLLEAEGDQLRVMFRDDNSHLQTPEFLASEKVRKRPNGLEPGLWFAPLRLPEQDGLLTELVSTAWPGPAAFDRARLLADAAQRQTLVGCRQDEPVGVVQFGPEAGWLSLACIRADCRKRGFGVQLIGQAVLWARSQKADFLRIVLPPSAPAQAFFTECGFAPADTADGRTIWAKDIRFDPEILGDSEI